MSSTSSCLAYGYYSILVLVLLSNLLLSFSQQSIAISELSSLSSIGFGSCNKQWLPQNHWNTIKDLVNPQLWIWLGDNIYTKNKTIAGLQAAYENISHDKLYADFRKVTRIEGVWDDHDYGVNDGGKHIDNYSIRRQLFTDFMNLDNARNRLPEHQQEVLELMKIKRGSELNLVDNNCVTDDVCPSPLVEASASSTGTYYSFEVPLSRKGLQSKDSTHTRTVKFILLDTRSFRDDHYIRSLAEYPFVPLSAILAAAVRAASGLFAIGRNYSGDILGEAQWAWLEKTLSESTADFHIIASSVQVLTTNPLYESWGHFPNAKIRLLNLIKKYDPSGIAMLSGDVHLAEVSYAKLSREDGTEDRLIEVTSSGLTHSCMTGITKFVCPWISSSFSEHREQVENVYLGTNFGTISLEPMLINSSVSIDELQISIFSLISNQSVLQQRVTPRNGVKYSPIVDVRAPEFPHLSETASADLIANMILMLGISICLFAYTSYMLMFGNRAKQSAT